MTRQTVSKIQTISVAIMLGLAVPLLALLYWAAEVFPNWDDSSSLVQLNDRSTLIVRHSSTNERWSSFMTRYLLLDNETGRVRRVKPYKYEPGGLTSGGTPFLYIMHNGMIVRSHDETQWLVHLTDPMSLADQSLSTEQGCPIPLCDRYLVSPIAPDKKQIRWFDLTEPNLPEHISQLTTYHTQLTRIPNSTAPVFFDLYQDPSKSWPSFGEMSSEDASQTSMEEAPDEPSLPTAASPPTSTTVPPTSAPPDLTTAEATELTDMQEWLPPKRPDWDAELDRLPMLNPKPHPSFKEFAMLALYRMSDIGPTEIAHWPVGIEASYSVDLFVNADGPYLFCMSLDAASIDVHDTLTGEIRSRIPLPKVTGPPSTIRWEASRFAVSIFNGTTYQTFDPSTGQPLPSDPNFGYVLFKQGDRYLELAPQTPNTSFNSIFKDWPPRLQVRHYPTGEILANYRMPDPKATFSSRSSADHPQLTADGQQVIVHTFDERIVYCDALTGHVNKIIRAASWPYYASILVIALLIAWIVTWIRIADRAALPRPVTMLVITAIVVCFLLLRLQLSGHPYLRLRLAVLGILAISTAWNAELMQHLLRPGCSLRSRTIALTAYLLCTFPLQTMLIPRYDSAETYLAWLYLSGCFAAFYFTLRTTGQLPPYPHDQPTQQFTLRSILIVTTLAAIGISIAYRQSWSSPSQSDPVRIAVNVALLTSIAAITLAVRHSFGCRIIAIPVSLTLATIVRMDLGDLADWVWTLSAFAACLAIAASFRVYPLSINGSTFGATGN